MIKVSKVNQTFRVGFWLKRSQILFDIDMTIKPQTVVGFLGANGAGKTTLIHLLIGLRSPVSGRIEIDGLDARSREARLKLGYLPERPYFYEHLHADQMLRYFGTLSGLNEMSREALTSRIGEVIKLVGLEKAHQDKLPLKKYSKGMLQRIGIAQAILHDPQLLILDEPMSGLDPVGRKEVRELIQALARAGKTIFFSSHVIPDVEAICDHVVLIQKGRIIDQGPVSELLKRGQGSVELVIATKWNAALEQTLKELRPSGVREYVALPEGTQILVDPKADTSDLVHKLLNAGHRIESIYPHRPSLESLFL